MKEGSGEMGNSIFDQAAKFMRDRRNNHRWLSIVLCLAIVVTVGTFYVLIRQGQAMSHKEQVLECQMQVHVHEAGCFDAENRLICLYSDYVLHMHNSDCYDANGVLVCQLPEIEAHTHDDSCYLREQRLICGMEESGAHTHDDSCYTKEQGDVICALAEHTHNESCYSVPEVQPAPPAEPAEGGAEGEGSAEAPAAEVPVVPAEPQLVCGLEEHQHANECYAWNDNLTCAMEEGAGHTHDESCYETVETLVCGKEQHILHTHGDECRSAEGFLVCGSMELNEHMHNADCFRTIELTGDEVAGLNPEPTEVPEMTEMTETTEVPEHEHDEKCYDEEGNLICEYAPEEEEEHVHGDDCYDEEGNLICGAEGHAHDENCYDEEGNLICEYAPEKEEEHVHGDDCYDEEGNLICGLEGHAHDENCYDEEGNLTCEYAPKEEEEHVHTDRCYNKEGNLICGFEAHEHNDSCYDEDGELICGYVTERSHEHDISCYDEDGELICGFEDAKDHEHDRYCYDEDGELICGYEGVKDHVHGEECYDEEGNLICGYDEGHIHDESCYDEKGRLICRYAKKHVHDESCYDEDGNLICGYDDEDEEPAEYTRIFQGDGYTITAIYSVDANIPEEAEFIAEQITPDSDGEHYAQREAEYQEAVENENASMRALLKVGFYVDGVEVEPESPVTLMIQFLDEDGLADGSPITVIHFADEGTEKLDGSRAENNSTTFQMESFSEIAIGYGQDEPITVEEESSSIYISRTFDYKNAAFQITFHIEGEATREDGEMFRSSTKKKTGSADESADADDESTTENEAEGAEEEDTGLTEQNGNGAESEETSGEEESVESEDNVSSDADQNGDMTGTDDAGETGSDDGDLSDQKLEFHLEILDENTEEYQTALSYMNDMDKTTDLLMVQVMSYSVTFGGAKLDLSACEVTAKITPTRALREYTIESIPQAISCTLYANEEEAVVFGNKADTDPGTSDADTSDEGTGSDGSAEDNRNGDLTGADNEETADGSSDFESDGLQEIPGNAQSGEEEEELIVAALALPNAATVSELDSMVLSEETPDETMRFTLNSPTFAVRVASQANPHFSVQYYATLSRLSDSGAASLDVINTHTDNGAHLPQNGNLSLSTTQICLDASGNVQMEDELMEVYAGREFQYIKAPSINYFDALVDNVGYELKEIWVMKPEFHTHTQACYETDKGEEFSEDEERVLICEASKDTNPDNWKVYPYSPDIHFTNRELSAGEGSGYILINKNATIRLVYDITTNDDSVFNGALYDYDISDGYQTSGNVKIMDTKHYGINSDGNYSGSGVKYAFGNKNCGTDYGENLWNGNKLNAGNRKTDGDPYTSFAGCTFGLVSGLGTDGNPVFSAGIDAPKLFGPTTEPIGKYQYPSDLHFKRNGDTYTLTSVTGDRISAANLHKFNHPSYDNGKVHYNIWTNNFWPMDGITDNQDMLFGRTKGGANTKTQKFGPGDWDNLPISDDGLDHNSFFGMSYEVDFELSGDYVGPLEYMFFGDDDMWVFLSKVDDNGNLSDSKLVCDIGGVHSSVGEYVDLWDYLKKGEEGIGKYRLSFFYTERGASGSTCWMQFTLPSVTVVTPETSTKDYGQLRIEKTVTKITSTGSEVVDNGDEFYFTIRLKGADGNRLPDDYSYTKYDKENNIIGHDLVIWNGGEFTLKNGEYIIIRYLPQGSKYEIVESDTALTIVDGTAEESEIHYFTDITVDGAEKGDNLETDKVADGSIPQKDTSVVHYNNKYHAYELPETGGSGTTPYTMAGVFCILSGAGLMYKKKFRERRFKKAS